ncbi:OPT oligopeptide transporter protein-domain-containing protein [Amylocarpus encephaloides]|uniref:OPT oligopeptide transporter protein-domain-containing protein n=1 Tax=Amylocarpus encephaloides TaxID=45428 RepID=A0A9P7YD18_9HELO|nr:OPT oligopeptide transporter protein-domain-containing protein [Amylocarpus encephaloides]
MSTTSEERPEPLYNHDIQSSETTELGSSSNVSQRTTLGDDKSSGRTPTPELKNEKDIPGLLVEEKQVDDEEVVPDDDPLLRDIPWQVRRVVSLQDDPNLPVFTFRYFFLTFLFIIPGAFLTQLNQYRTTFAPYSIFFVQIASNYIGDWMARTLPAWNVRLPFTKRSFNLNPGPFSPKEHVMVTISASSGATYNLAFAPISMSELYFGTRINPGVCLFFMLAVVFLGYGYAAIARQFLVNDPQYPWYQALCQTALFETQKHQRESPSPVSKRQTMVFFLVLVGVTIWQFLPEYVFPFLQSLAFLCWVAPHNETANFIGGGMGGMGFLNLSLDWSNISAFQDMGSLFLTPWWTQVIVFLGFVINCWILLPLSKWGGLNGGWNHHLMSNRIYTQNGTRYPLLDVMTSVPDLNITKYEEIGPLYVSAQLRWGMFFDFASFTSAMVWMAMFGYPALKSAVLKFRERVKSGRTTTINDQFPDQLNVLMRKYPQVPVSWYLGLVGFSFLVIMTTVAKTDLYIPWWTVIVAMGTGAIVVVPLGWLYAVSNFQLPIGTTNELLYGIMVNAIGGYKNPVGAFVYSTIAGDAWYRAQIMLQDQKIGHYMHLPPRAVFFSQVFGSIIGVPINYGVIRWVLDTKFDLIAGNKIDPTHQWTGQSLASALTVGAQYVLIGPKRLFAGTLYKGMPYGFLLGALTPPILFFLHRYFPRAKFNLWNSTIFYCVLGSYWGNLTAGPTSSIIGGFVVMYYAYRNYYEVWARYNYILAAAFDAGFNLNLLILFLALGAGKIVSMPHWWGNNEDTVERCFAMPKG